MDFQFCFSLFISTKKQQKNNKKRVISFFDKGKANKYRNKHVVNNQGCYISKFFHGNVSAFDCLLHKSHGRT